MITCAITSKKEDEKVSGIAKKGERKKNDVELLTDETEEIPTDEILSPTPDSDESVSSTSPKTDGRKQLNFTEQRFVNLFQRNSRPRPLAGGLVPRFNKKPKPTLPSFIKNTPPLLKATPSNVVVTQRTTPRKITTTTKPPRSAVNSLNRNDNRRRAQETTSTTTPSSARRRFGFGTQTKKNTTTSGPFRNKRF